MLIGKIGMKFIKKFSKYFYTGEVMQILSSSKSVCKFNDNSSRQYSRDQLKKFSKTISNSIFVLDSNSNSNASKSTENNEILSIDDSDNESIDQPLNLLLGKLFKELICIPIGKLLEEYSEDLRNRKLVND